MEKVKLSTLSKNTLVYTEGSTCIHTVGEILEDITRFTDKNVYVLAKEHQVILDAKSIIDKEINDKCNEMYEDWGDYIKSSIIKEDIMDMQNILDRILSRNPVINMSYIPNMLIEFDYKE